MAAGELGGVEVWGGPECPCAGAEGGGNAPLPEPPRGGSAAPPPPVLGGCHGAEIPLGDGSDTESHRAASQPLSAPALARGAATISPCLAVPSAPSFAACLIS